MKTGGRSIIGGVFLLAGAPGLAAVSSPGGIRLGVSAGAEYNTNVARASAARAASRGLDRADIRYRPAVTVGGTRGFGRQSLTVSGFAGYDFYQKNTRLNRERITLDTVAALSLARCTGTAGLSFARRQSELGDFLAVNDTDVTTITNTETVTTASGALRCGAQVGFKPTASVSASRARNSAARRAFAEYDSVAVAGGLAYERPSLGLVSLLANYGRTTFPRRAALFGPGADGAFDTIGGSVRIERALFSRLTGSAQLGYTKVRPDTAGVRDFSGLTWAATLSANVSSRLQLGGNLDRSIRSSNLVAASYFVLTLYGAQASYALGDRTTLSASLLHRERRFRGSQFIAGPADVTDTTDTLGATARFAVNRKLNLSAYVDHNRRNVPGDLDDYRDNRIGISAGYTFR